MGLLRLLFWGLLIYFAYKAIQQVLGKRTREPEVKGKPKQKPLNIDESKIEDAEFEELDDK